MRRHANILWIVLCLLMVGCRPDASGPVSALLDSRISTDHDPARRDMIERLNRRADRNEALALVASRITAGTDWVWIEVADFDEGLSYHDGVAYGLAGKLLGWDFAFAYWSKDEMGVITNTYPQDPSQLWGNGRWDFLSAKGRWEQVAWGQFEHPPEVLVPAGRAVLTPNDSWDACSLNQAAWKIGGRRGSACGVNNAGEGGEVINRLAQMFFKTWMITRHTQDRLGGAAERGDPTTRPWVRWD